MIGIGVSTCQRPAALLACLAAVRRHTREPYRLVVANDGDEPVVTRPGEAVVSGRRMGIGWNRNRALYWLMERTTLDDFLLLEDDAHPCADGWERAWLDAAADCGYLGYCWPRGGPVGPPCTITAGDGTPASPYYAVDIGTQVVAVRRDAVIAVGYSDPRFTGLYGYEDTDWRWRYGDHFQTRRGSQTQCLNSGVRVADYGSFSTAPGVMEANRAVLEAIRDERPLFRLPYRDAAQHRQLVGEMLAAREA